MPILITIFIYSVAFAFAGFLLWLIATGLVLGVGVISMVIKLPIDLVKYFREKVARKERRELVISVINLKKAIENKKAKSKK